MQDAIRKLKEKNIFHNNSLVESEITKWWYDSPVQVKSTLIVKEMKNDYCICNEYREADGKAYKIRYLDITTIDGMNPNELAAVYGLGPKTERFKKHRNK